MSSVPAEIWLIIAVYLDASPFVYLRLAQVCHTAKSVFLSDLLWWRFTPYDIKEDLARRFSDRTRQFTPEQLAFFASIWSDLELAFGLRLQQQRKLFIEHNSHKYETALCAENLDLLLPFVVWTDLRTSLHPSKYQTLEGFRYWGNRPFVLAAVSKDGWLLPFANVFLDDDQIVLAAVRASRSPILNFVSFRLRNVKDVVLAAVCHCAPNIQWASPNLRADRDVALAVVSEFGTELEWVSPELRNDWEFMLDAVEIHGKALKYASPELQRNSAFVKAALQVCPKALPYVQDDVRKQIEAEKKSGVQRLAKLWSSHASGDARPAPKRLVKSYQLGLLKQFAGR